MEILSTRGVLEQGACLGALISLMLDSSANQIVCNELAFDSFTLVHWPCLLHFKCLSLSDFSFRI